MTILAPRRMAEIMLFSLELLSTQAPSPLVNREYLLEPIVAVVVLPFL